MGNRLFAFIVGLLCFTLVACEKPEDTAKRIEKTPCYLLTDLTVSKDGKNFIICTELGTMERTADRVIIKYSQAVAKPMVKNYAYGDLAMTELIFRDRDDYLKYLKEKAKIVGGT